MVLIYKFTPHLNSGMREGTDPSTVHPLTNGPSWLSVVWTEPCLCLPLLPLLSTYQRNISMGNQLSHDPSIALVVRGFSWIVLTSTLGPSSSTLWWSLGMFYQEDSNPKIIIYEFISSQMKFIQKQHIKLDETGSDKQGCFKEKILNVMDGLGRLTSKV